MEAMFALEPETTAASSSSISVDASPSVETPIIDPQVAPVSPHLGLPVPRMIGEGQAYYWTSVWQAGQRESADDLAAGRFREFDSASDAIRYLLAADDD